MGTKLPKREISKEVRFAVVMYGGVSLAIYINGIAQELHRMVRATAAKPQDSTAPLLSDEKLHSSERVYRQLSRILGREEKEERPCGSVRPIRTRFVVDILSGTSAGGINAVYLGKALANGQKIDQLKNLWIEEGDIEKLINDEESVEQLEPELEPQKPPKALLNGQRMYVKLLQALNGMDKIRDIEHEAAPYVEELDLFVTATDMRGLPVPLKLKGQLAWENRHRNVFHFRYSGNGRSEEECNDFHAQNNPFLAFAARSTSAFPFAFEPMKLADINPLQRTASAEDNRWRKFFPDYRKPPGASSSGFGEDGCGHDNEPGKHEYEYQTRAFGDGGYLDNKPFGYAIDALAARQSSVPVDRKLIYIEPSPEHPEIRGEDDSNEDAIENVVAAFSLARYETIREDLQRILYRNRLIERVESIIQEVDSDVQKGRLREGPVRDSKFGESDLGKMIQAEGIAYGGYHRLKVAAVTDAIATMIACAANFDVQSDEFFAIRYLVRAWRERNYAAYNEPGKETQNKFLLQYDLEHHLRRLDFVLGRIDQLYPLDGQAQKILECTLGPIPDAYNEKQAFRAELAWLRGKLTEVIVPLRQTREALKQPGDKNPLHEKVKDTNLSWHDLRAVLRQPSEQKRDTKARDMMFEPARAAAFNKVARVLRICVDQCTEKAAARCQEIWNSPSGSEGPRRFTAAARRLVGHYYDSYDRYDMISYPILYATEVGEEIDQVEVIRISPEDACFLDQGRLGSRKLAGTALRNFGAFFDRGWRQNDILWGRLDGAERIITTLLSEWDQEEKEKCIREAQLEILEDELKISDRDRLLQLLTDAMIESAPDAENETELRRIAEQERRASDDSVFKSALRASLSKESLFGFFRRSYEPNREINPMTASLALSRAARVAGEMFRDIAEQHSRGRRLAAWGARLGRAFSGLVEVSVPGRLGNWIFRRWLVLLYAFEAFLVLAGLLLSAEVYRLGLITLGITAVLHVSTLALGDFMHGKRWYLSVPIFAGSVVLILLVVLGIIFLVVYLPDILVNAVQWLWSWMQNW